MTIDAATVTLEGFACLVRMPNGKVRVMLNTIAMSRTRAKKAFKRNTFLIKLEPPELLDTVPVSVSFEDMNLAVWQ